MIRQSPILVAVAMTVAACTNASSVDRVSDPDEAIALGIKKCRQTAPREWPEPGLWKAQLEGDQ